MNTIFTGCATALITPFTETGVDFPSFGRLLESQIEGGVDALLVCGTTGEPATMTGEERAEVIRFAIHTVNKRVPVIVGTGSNSTASAVENAKAAAAAGADALLVVTPYYNKCTQKGLLEHYRAVCSATDLPVICYNVPGRTGVNIQPATLQAMAEELPTLQAIKEASGSIEQIAEMSRRTAGRLDIYSGDDGIIVPVLSVGGKGVISVVSNLAPGYVHRLCADFFAGNTQEACRGQLHMLPLVKALFCEVNPIPVKTGAALMGICGGALRLPLCAMEEKNLETLRTAMTDFGLI